MHLQPYYSRVKRGVRFDVIRDGVAVAAFVQRDLMERLFGPMRSEAVVLLTFTRRRPLLEAAVLRKLEAGEEPPIQLGVLDVPVSPAANDAHALNDFV